MEEPSSTRCPAFVLRLSSCNSPRDDTGSAVPASERLSYAGETRKAWDAARGAVLAAATATVAAAAASAPPADRAALATHSAAPAAPRGGACGAGPAVFAETEAGGRKLSPGPTYFSDAYYRRLLLSFSSAQWFCPPRGLSPFLLARNGFRCIDTGTVECVVCGEKWSATRGLHSEIEPTLAGATQTNASAADDAGLLLPIPAAGKPPPSLCSAAGAAGGGRAGDGGVDDSHPEATRATMTATAVSTATAAAAVEEAAGAAPPARSTSDKAGETAKQEAQKKKEPEEEEKQQQQRHPTKQQGEEGVVERALLKQQGLAGISGRTNNEVLQATAAADSAVGGQLEPPDGKRSRRREGKHMDEEEEKERKSEEKASGNAYMDAVALSFLHAECCPWRNAFIPLAAIHLDGAALHPATLISQWTHRVQQLRRAAAAAVPCPQVRRHPRVTFQSARAFLLSALIAAAEAAATAQPRTAAHGIEAATSEIPPERLGSDLSEAAERGAPHRQVTRTGSVQGETGGGAKVKETSCSSRLLGTSHFFSSPQSPLEAACVSQLSKKEVQLLRQLWLFICEGDGEVETSVLKCMPSGTVIPPVCASTLLLERRCALREGSERYKLADEYLSLPILETLLHQVTALLFDPRVPLPGSRGPSSLLTSTNLSSDEVSPASFKFPTEREPVHVDCNKMLAFFGWAPVTDCTQSEQQSRTIAAEDDRQQERQKSTATLGDLDRTSPVPQQPQEHAFLGTQALQHAGAPSGEKKTDSGRLQQNQSVGENKIGTASRGNVERNLTAVTARGVIVEEQKLSTKLECMYCFRRVDMTDYVFSADDGQSSSDKTLNVFFSNRVDHLEESEKAAAGKMLAEGWRRRTQIGGDEGTPPSGLRKDAESANPTGEVNTSARNMDNGEKKQENTAGVSEGAQSPKNVVNGAGGVAPVNAGKNGSEEQNSLSSGNPCITADVHVEIEGRQDDFAGDSKEAERDTSLVGMQVHAQPTQAIHIPSTERSNNRRKRETKKASASSARSFDPVCTHRLHCPYVCNAVYKNKLPIVLKLFFPLLPVLIETIQFQVEKRRLEAEIRETWSFRKRPPCKKAFKPDIKNHHT